MVATMDLSQYHISQETIQDELLIIEAAKKNASAFKPLYEKYFETIYRYVFRRVDNRDDARDITQQVFINALSNISKYEYRGVPFTSWLYRIAYNEVVKAVRKNETTRTVSIEADSLGVLLKETMEEEPGMEAREKGLSVCLSGLKEEELKLVELRYFEDRPFKEVSEIIQVTENNAKVKMHRILQKLKACIQGKLAIG
jgi:RNA polymerase sigma-70 factor (ECF subfamily)